MIELCQALTHMGDFTQPQQKYAGASENQDIGAIRFVSAQILRNIFKICLLDGSRSRRSWGFPNFHDFWVAPGPSGAILMGPQKKQVGLLGTSVDVLEIRQKKLDGLYLLERV